MPKICYQPKRFGDEAIKLIGAADSIMHNYAQQGFELSLRQLYYQFVARGTIRNSLKEYTRLGNLISDARLAGLLDWHQIVDRTRGSISNAHYDKPSDILMEVATGYQIDKWQTQPHYVEVWIEKDALSDVISGPCSEMDVRYFSCRGYTSQSAMWVAAQRLLVQSASKGKQVHIIHLGDHDPSGIDMSRDIKSRLEMFTYGAVHVQRVALNMPQIQRYNPPPNPAKTTDSRFEAYLSKYGNESWELDALDPNTIVDVVRRAIKQYWDETKWNEALQLEQRGRQTLDMLITNFSDVVKFLREKRNGSSAVTVLCNNCGATTEHPYCSCQDKDLSKNIQIG